MAETNKNIEENKVEEKDTSKRRKCRIRTVLVLFFLAIFLICMYVTYRADYIETMEIGENYLDVFNQNIKYKLFIAGSNFVFIFVIVCITNMLIKRGLKKFFEQEKIDMPKLPNKSIALILGLIMATVTPDIFPL